MSIDLNHRQKQALIQRLVEAGMESQKAIDLVNQIYK